MKLNWLFSNPVNLWIVTHQGSFIAGVLLFFGISVFLPAQLSWLPIVIFSALCIWFCGQGVSTFHWRRKSRKMGLRNFLIRSVPPDQFSFLTRRRGIDFEAEGPTLEVHTWTHGTYRKRGGIDEYQRDLHHDAMHLAQLVRDGRLKYRTITCNSFNPYLIKGLATAFHGFKTDYLPGVVVVPSCLKLYRPKRFRKEQLKMFGRVYSQRKVDVARKWDLLIVQTERGASV